MRSGLSSRAMRSAFSALNEQSNLSPFSPYYHTLIQEKIFALVSCRNNGR